MPRSRQAVLLLTTLLLLLPAAAQASSTSHRSMRPNGHGAHIERTRLRVRDEVRIALGVAETYWGATPCAGAIAVTAASRVPIGMAPDTDAWVTFDSSLGADNLAAPASTYAACKIGLDVGNGPPPRRSTATGACSA